MSMSLAADEEELRLVPIIHIMAVLSLLPDPLVSLLLGDVFLRLAPNSSAASGELGGEFGLLTSELLDIEPNELLGNKVPFLGGLPIRFPVLENLAVVEELEDLLGLGKPFIVAGEVKLAEFSMLVEEVSILSGFPGPPGPPPLIGMIFAGESFRGIGGILSSLSIVKS